MFFPKRLIKVSNRASDSGTQSACLMAPVRSSFRKGERLMKRISLITVVALTLTLLISAYGQTPQSGSIKKVQVTAQTITRQPVGTPYRIDLTRPRTVYEVAGGIDYSRVEVLTTQGKMTLNDLVRRTGSKLGSTSGKFLLGMGSDVVQQLKLNTGGTLQPRGGRPSAIASCKPLYCTCTGLPDCIDVLTKGECKGPWTCGPYTSDEEGPLYCLCLKEKI
jgi:hypothetical protein